MSALIDFTFKCFSQLNQYFHTFWPVKILFGTKLKSPSTDTELKVLRLIYLLHHEKEANLPAIYQMVESLPVNEDVFSICDQQTNYDLLQLAVIKNDKYLVQVLAKKYNVNSKIKCSPPVHLAAYLGHCGILEDLFKHGAKSGDIAGLCYPEQHKPLRTHSFLGLIDYTVYKCKLNVHLPIFSAIAKDNIKCVKLIINRMQEEGVVIPLPSALLHFACHRGAINCIQYFVSKYPGTINTLDENRDTPLLAAVVWGKDCAKCLIDNGADVKMVSKIGETALHRLYRNDIDGLFSIYDTTKYLLTTGIEQLVNQSNDAMETPLHYLVTHVSFIGGDLLHPCKGQGHVSRWQLQPDYQDQVIKTLKLLLQFNADVLKNNGHRLQPINRMMHIALKMCDPDRQDWPSCVRSCIDSKYLYQNSFKYLHLALEVLLQNRSDPNIPCCEGHTPYTLLLLCLLEMDIEEMCIQSHDIIQSFITLLQYGANPNFVFANKGTCSTVLAKVALRIMKGATTASSNKTREEFTDLICQLLSVHFRYGLNPNHITQVKSTHLGGGTGNAVIEFVRLAEHASKPSDFIAIRRWLCTIFQWGADPDIEPYPSEPIICHSQSSIFLRHQGTQPVNHYINEAKDLDGAFQDGYGQELLLLFYNTMSHDKLYECLNSARSLTRFHPLCASGRQFLSFLNSLAENPRSLMQISRVVIYKAIGRDLVRKVPQLPLPKAMRAYLLEVQ